MIRFSLSSLQYIHIYIYLLLHHIYTQPNISIIGGLKVLLNHSQVQPKPQAVVKDILELKSQE